MEENFGIYLWMASMALLLGLLIALVTGIPMATFLAVFAAILVSLTLVASKTDGPAAPREISEVDNER
jgi:hypothetical protein